MIEPVSVPEGHDSDEQSRTPLPKSMLEHRHVMLLLAQPKLTALPNMLLMHVFYPQSLANATDTGHAWSRDIRRMQAGC